MKHFLVSLLLIAFLATSCMSKSNHVIKIAATPIPHAEMLSFIRPLLKKEGIDLRIIEIDDYHLPNRLLAEGKVDVNFFQHAPFLQEQQKHCGYNFAILKKVHVEPLGVYSRKIPHLKELPTGALVAIPSDPTNEGRALQLLAAEGLITLKASDSLLVTPLDVIGNPLKIHFVEIDAALLAPVLADVVLAVIPSNFALQAHLSPIKDALLMESSYSPYANLLVVRKGEEEREDFKKLVNALGSKEMDDFLLKSYGGGVLPVKNNENVSRK